MFILWNISCSLYTAETSEKILSFLQLKKKFLCLSYAIYTLDFKIQNFWSNLENIGIQFVDKLKLVAEAHWSDPNLVDASQEKVQCLKLCEICVVLLSQYVWFCCE